MQSPKTTTAASPVDTTTAATSTNTTAATDSDTNVNAVPEWVAPRRRPEPIYDPFQADNVPATPHRIHIVKVTTCVLSML